MNQSNQSHTSRITTHVLDAATGVPAEGVPVELSGRVGGEDSAGGDMGGAVNGTAGAGSAGGAGGAGRGDWRVIAEGTTDADGRIMRLGGDDLPPGEYRIRFDTGAYFRARNAETFYPEAVVTFIVTDDGRHVHVPLLLSPFAYSTYRGS